MRITGPPPPPPTTQEDIRANSNRIFDGWSRRLVPLPTTEVELQAAVQALLPVALPSPRNWIAGADQPAADVVRVATAGVSLSPDLESIRSHIVSLEYHGDTEDSTHAAVDLLILNPIKKVCLFGNCIVRTNRNGVDRSSATLKMLRPDVLLWLPSGVLAFKGEDKATGVDIQEARHDLRTKMNVFSDAFFGRVPYQLAYACSGSLLEFVAFMRTDNPARPQEVQLTNVIDLATISGRTQCVRYAVNIARLLMAIHQEHRDGNVIRLGSTLSTPSSTVVVAGDYVKKKARQYTGAVIVDLYGRIKVAGRIPHLIFPSSDPRVGRNTLAVDLEPVGFCGRVPTTAAECKKAGRSVLTALAWLHENGFVHRDIREVNIMLAGGEWFLIDLEWANYENLPMEGYNPTLCPPERSTQGFVWATSADMWQFGKLLERWNQLDALGVNFVNNLTNPDPSIRLTATQALNHEFFREEV